MVLMTVHGRMNDTGGIVVIAVQLRVIRINHIVFVVIRLIHQRFVGHGRGRRCQLMLMREHRLIDVMMCSDCGGRLTWLDDAMMTVRNRLMRMQLRIGHWRWFVLHDRWNAHRRWRRYDRRAGSQWSGWCHCSSRHWIINR